MDSSCLNAALRSLSSLHVLHLENQVDQAVLESGLLLPPSVRVFSFCFSNSSSLASLLRAISRLPHLQDLSVLGHGAQRRRPARARVARLRTLKVRAAEDLPYAAARAARCDVLNLASLDLRTGCEGPAWRIPPGFEGVLGHGDEPEEGFDSDDEELGAAADYSEAMYALVRTAVPVRLACAVTVGGAGFGGGTLWARLAREGPSVRSLVLRVEEEQAKEDSNRWQWLTGLPDALAPLPVEHLALWAPRQSQHNHRYNDKDCYCCEDGEPVGPAHARGVRGVCGV
ncbi:uncharacterized protein BXZ73DRAFT_83691 [Epithele typhae]|uniref:uncharacterized protein n=1 Tax=Epithele typhae TaxID=378194 RepID=UPI002007EB53|nr:uncharacterized protein BXZ73DRAFT_83691 [Epithele typhae]KAH9910322.1 hypothetical protein BXZ73DRAFT_83691 [Epithele typhae]